MQPQSTISSNTREILSLTLFIEYIRVTLDYIYKLNFRRKFYLSINFNIQNPIKENKIITRFLNRSYN